VSGDRLAQAELAAPGELVETSPDDPAERTHAGDEARRRIDTLKLAMMFVDLDDLTVRAISRAALKGLGVPPSSVVGRPLMELAVHARRSDLQNVLEAMRAGGIDSYRARGTVGIGPSGHTFTVWAEAFQVASGCIVLVQVAQGIERQQSPLAEYLGSPPLAMAVGTIDPGWVITEMSADVEELVDMPAEDVVGRRLVGWVDQRDVRKLLDAGRMAHREHSTVVRLRVRNGGGGWTPTLCVLTSLAGSIDLSLILLPEPGPAPAAGAPAADLGRVAQLEEHLWRIAAEIEASGMARQRVPIPDPERFPQLGGLSSRQSEVLRHLVRGERVPTIAKQLFLSQSTVRNHLAAIFRRFNVHSQPALLALFATDRPDDPAAT
jgi:DNA-binding CsgD family transcriptional regulator